MGVGAPVSSLPLPLPFPGHHGFPQFIIICDSFLFLESLLKKDPVFAKGELVFLSREESYSQSLQKGVHFIHLLKQHKITDDEEKLMLRR